MTYLKIFNSKLMSVIILLIIVVTMIINSIYYNNKETSNNVNKLIINTKNIYTSIITYEHDETDIDNENINITENELLNNLFFTVDITDVDYINNIFICNTSTEKSYSGIAKFSLKSGNAVGCSIEVSKTYVIETDPLIETDEVPKFTVISYREADEDEIEQLENVRSNVSNYLKYYIDFNNMTLEEFIDVGNKNYATWTQDEIQEYINILKGKGYKETNKKSYVNTRDSLNGSYITDVRVK